MERLADNAHRPRPHALHRLRRPGGDRGEDQAVHRPRLHRAGLPLPGQRPAPLHRRVRRRRHAAAAQMSPFEQLDERFRALRQAHRPARPPLRRLPLGRGPRVLPGAPRARLVGHPEQPDPPLRRGHRRRRRVPQPEGYTNGHTVDRAGPARELRARQPPRHPHRARRHDHRARRRPTRASA